MLRDTCHPGPDNLANKDKPPDNKNIALASMKIRVEQVTTKDAALYSNTVAAEALATRLTTHSSERPQQG